MLSLLVGALGIGGPEGLTGPEISSIFFRPFLSTSPSFCSVLLGFNHDIGYAGKRNNACTVLVSPFPLFIYCLWPFAFCFLDSSSFLPVSHTHTHCMWAPHHHEVAWESRFDDLQASLSCMPILELDLCHRMRGREGRGVGAGFYDKSLFPIPFLLFVSMAFFVFALATRVSGSCSVCGFLFLLVCMWWTWRLLTAACWLWLRSF